MFKRVLKRQRRKEEEEELGLDEEMKEVMGLHDTDSEESESSADEGGSEGEAGSGAEDEEDDDDEDAQDDAPELSEEGDEEEDEGEDELPPMTVTAAVQDPVYVVSPADDTRACILCPGKLLKNSKAVEVHKASKAHNRRFTRFVELVGQAGPEGDVHELIRAVNAGAIGPAAKPEGSELSKRAMKRREKLAAVKAKREKHKQAKAKARKRKEEPKAHKAADEAGPSAVDVPAEAKPASPDRPPKKKRKVATPKDDMKPAPTKPDGSASERPVDREIATKSVVSRTKKANVVSSKPKERRNEQAARKPRAKGAKSERTAKPKHVS